PQQEELLGSEDRCEFNERYCDEPDPPVARLEGSTHLGALVEASQPSRSAAQCGTCLLLRYCLNAGCEQFGQARFRATPWRTLQAIDGWMRVGPKVRSIQGF